MKQDVSCALYAFWFLNVGLKVVRENPGFEERVSGEAEPVPVGREAQGLSPVGSAGCPQPGSGLSSRGSGRCFVTVSVTPNCRYKMHCWREHFLL